MAWWFRLHLPKQGVWVSSLVGELSAYMPGSQKTKTWNGNNIATNLVKISEGSTSKKSLKKKRRKSRRPQAQEGMCRVSQSSEKCEFKTINEKSRWSWLEQRLASGVMPSAGGDSRTGHPPALPVAVPRALTQSLGKLSLFGLGT